MPYQADSSIWICRPRACADAGSEVIVDADFKNALWDPVPRTNSRIQFGQPQTEASRAYLSKGKADSLDAGLKLPVDGEKTVISIDDLANSRKSLFGPLSPVMKIDDSQPSMKSDPDWPDYDAKSLDAIADKACEDMMLLDNMILFKLDKILSEGSTLTDLDLERPALPPASARPSFEKVHKPAVAIDDGCEIRESVVTPSTRAASMVSPGDILNIRGRYNALSRLGASGGFMGHVILAVSEEKTVPMDSDTGKVFYEYTDNGRKPLLAVSIAECSRQSSGLSESQLILYTENSSVFLLGEDDGRELTRFEDIEEVHIWHGPAVLCGQGNFNLFLMKDILAEMRANQRNWSWATAVRAFLLSGEMSHRDEAPVTMREIRESWKAEPICSSMVVSFWQQYLYRFAQLQGADPLQLILKNMPLKADRVLPGELLQCLLAHGWTLGQTRCSTSSDMDGLSRSWTLRETQAFEVLDKEGLSRSHSL